jgi:hypothetical protein
VDITTPLRFREPFYRIQERCLRAQVNLDVWLLLPNDTAPLKSWN